MTGKPLPGSTFEYPKVGGRPEKLAFGIGALVMQWGVCESTFYTLLETLAGKPNTGIGVVIWFSIRSNRGRVELIERLSRAVDISTGLQSRVADLCKRFKVLTRSRDFYCHAEYRTVGMNGEVSHIVGRQFSEKDDPLKLEVREVSDKLLAQIQRDVEAASILAADALKLMLALQSELRVQHPVLPQELLEALATTDRLARPDTD